MAYGFNNDKSKYQLESSTTYSNIAVSATPTALASYNAWDTQHRYGYSADIAISGLTENSLIENIVLTDTLMDAIAPIITTGTDKITIYTESNSALSGTIHTLVVKEVN